MAVPLNLVSLKSGKLVWRFSGMCGGVEISAWASSLQIEGQKISVLMCCWMCAESNECWMLLIRLCQIKKFHQKLPSTKFFLWWRDKLAKTKSCNIVLAFPTDMVVWMIHKCCGTPMCLAGLWKENASPQKSPSRNREPKYDCIRLASPLFHPGRREQSTARPLRKEGITSGRKGIQGTGWSSLLFGLDDKRVVRQV